MNHRVKEFLRDSLRIIICCLYPLSELYLYFVFSGILSFSSKDSLSDWVAVLCYLFYNYLLLYKIIVYIELFAIEEKSTLDLFPQLEKVKVEATFSGVNPFVVESIRRSSARQVQICELCGTYKPPRTHHSTARNKCYLKYDHYCTFLDTVIGYHNYKMFYQFLAVTTFTSGGFFGLVLADMLATWGRRTKTSLVNYIVGCSIAWIIFCSTASMLVIHTIQICRNETTIEAQAINRYIQGDISFTHVFHEGPIKDFLKSTDRKQLNPYNLGVKENWLEVFGNRPLDWLRPVPSSRGNGILFKTNTQDQEENAPNLPTVI